jgi:ribose transport system permease protein
VLPQHWVNVFIGLILITAVLGDIWLRQADIFGRLRRRFPRANGAHAHA